MAMPGRTSNSPDYRYGFNGKEKDESGEWGDLTHYDYGFRIYNPGIGKFLSVDPLTKEYPWYTPYQFAGNMPTWAIDMDGLEPVVEGGILIGYNVQAGQGPTQIAADINDPRIQERYGYTLMNKVEWEDVVWTNYDTFKDKSKVDKLENINDPNYRSMNINPGDYLDICAECASNPASDPVHTLIVGADAGAALIAGGTASAYTFKIEENSSFWETGNVIIYGAEVQATPSKKPGGEIGLFNTGLLNIYSTSDPGLRNVFTKPVTTFSGGLISPYGVGGRYIQMIGQGGFDAEMGSLTFGYPGPTGSVSVSELGVGGMYVPSLKNKQDSLSRSRELLQNFPAHKDAHEYQQKNDSTYQHPVNGGY